MRALSRKRDVSWKMCLLIVLVSQRIAWPWGNEEIVALLTPNTDRELLKTPLYVFAALIVALFVWLFRRRRSFFAPPNWSQDTSNRRSMQMSVHELVDPIVEARILAPETPDEPGTANQASVFTNTEWEQFREEDNSAGRAIGKFSPHCSFTR